jgi:hypothetical protein
MWHRATWLLAGTLLLGAGEYSESSWQKIRPSVPEIGRKEIEPSLGQGVLLGVLGGLRNIIADGTWIRSYVYWEKKDRAACEALMRTACALDPRSRYFWENTGCVIGYDMAHWEIRRRGGYNKVTREIQDEIFKKYARHGLTVFEEGVKYTGGSPSLLISAGQLSEIKLKDSLLAAEYYRRAAESRGAPWFAYFLCAKSYWEGGKKVEAYLWYRKQYIEKLLPMEDGSPDDLNHLRYFEEELNVPFLQRIPRQKWEKKI